MLGPKVILCYFGQTAWEICKVVWDHGIVQELMVRKVTFTKNINWLSWQHWFSFLGPPCDTNRENWGNIECYYSCPLCNPENSCDWTSCYDDLGFLEHVIMEEIAANWCVDLDHLHLSGISNGGMFAYYVASTATDGLGIPRRASFTYSVTLAFMYKIHQIYLLGDHSN